jgi:hypothetical protein
LLPARRAGLARFARPVHQDAMSVMRTFLVCLTLLASLAGCQWRSISPAQDAELRNVFEQVRKGDLASVENAFEPKYRTPGLHADLPQWQDQIPQGVPQIQRINAAAQTVRGVTDYGASYEYDYPGGRALLSQVEMRQDAAGKKTITAFRVVKSEPHLLDRYRFGVMGKKPQQYAFLVLVLLAPVLGVWGVIAVWRAPDLPRKWKPLWTLAMALGFMDLTMDWATGDVFLQINNLHILWITAKQFSPLSPWMISTSLPLAAIAFLIGYRPPKA